MDKRLTQKAFAEHIGVTQPAVAKLVAASVVDLRRGLDQSRLDYIAHLREVAAGREGKSGEYDLTDERARLAHHQANIAQMQEQEQRGTLVPATWLQDALANVFAVVHSRVGSLAHRVRAVHRDLTGDQYKALEKAVYDARLDIADAVEDELKTRFKRLENSDAKDE
ncbi:MAG: hypothetical protein KDE45_00330 [Caldilineaceae bacterium]|nr:hypothetical protein [Caldilineaceae bacterium]